MILIQLNVILIRLKMILMLLELIMIQGGVREVILLCSKVHYVLVHYVLVLAHYALALGHYALARLCTRNYVL